MNTHDFEIVFGPARVEFASESRELGLALAHIYRAFVSNGCHDAHPSLLETPNGDGWRAWVDGRGYHFEEIYRACRGLENVIAKRLFAGVAKGVHIHAAAVEDDCHTIVLCGPSNSGKTTMALELVRRGRTYLTDEYTVIDPSGTMILPFPRSAHRRREGVDPPGLNLHVPHSKGYRAFFLPEARAELTARKIRDPWFIFPVGPRRFAGETPSARPIKTGECCARLIQSTFRFEGNESAQWPIMSRFAAGGRACVLEYLDAQRDLDLALELLEAQW